MTKKKLQLVLDLDSTLISAKKEKELKTVDHSTRGQFTVHNMTDSDGKVNYIVFERPGLQKFLAYIFENFDVSIWTAASKDYAMFIIEKIIIGNHQNRKLHYVFFSYHCDISEEKSKNKCTKDLSLLWSFYRLSQFNKDNTVILDDYIEDVFDKQKRNCIIAPEFDIVKHHGIDDKFLTQIIPVLREHGTNSETVTSVSNRQFSKDYVRNRRN
jgi:TFIIF-interacting CTD phosphatase-like protein